MILEHLTKLSNLNIVLASASPRRSEILRNIGLRVKVVPSTFAEDLDKGLYRNGAEYAKETALQKAREVASRPWDKHDQPSLVIAADTVVELKGNVLEKPQDAADAACMLTRLSGHAHHVHTGVALISIAPQHVSGAGAAAADEAHVRSFSSATEVVFAALSAAEIQAYVATGECFGKAGAYGIQGPAGAWVTSITGCYFNVMGFPVHAFAAALADMIASGELPL